MARAKRTHRAEARRRYRSEQGLPTTFDDAEIDAPTSTAADATRSTASTTPAPARPSIGNAFRQAFHPLDVRSDLRALPQLLRTRALWIPIILTVGSTALYLAIGPVGRSDLVGVLALFLFQYFVVTPAIGGVFIAGFMAPRASWLLGILVGLVAAACYSFLMLSGALGVTAGPQNENLAREFVAASFFLSPVVGAFFAATAAWYRRFLQLSNPNRGRGRGAAPPRPDGRTRAARPGQQKAVPRR